MPLLVSTRVPTYLHALFLVDLVHVAPAALPLVPPWPALSVDTTVLRNTAGFVRVHALYGILPIFVECMPAPACLFMPAFAECRSTGWGSSSTKNRIRRTKTVSLAAVPLLRPSFMKPTVNVSQLVSLHACRIFGNAAEQFGRPGQRLLSESDRVSRPDRRC